nr:putative uncharacterized protein DDB_G0287113 [Arachis hypogaea]
MNFLPEPQSDSYCYDTNTNYGWEWNFNAVYSNHSKTLSLDYAVDTYMDDFSPEPQNDQFYNDSHCGWEDQNQKAFDSSYSTYQEPSSLEQTINSFMESCQTSPPSFSSENSSSLNYPLTQNLFQNSQSTQTFMNQSLSKFETMLERYEEEAQISWNEQENSLKNMEVLVNQMLSAREEVEEQNEEAPKLSKTSPPDFSCQNFPSLEYTSTQRSFHIPQNNLTTTHPYPQNFSQPSYFELVAEDPLQNSRELLEKQEQFLEEQKQFWTEQEILLKKMDGHLEQIRRNSELSSKEDEDQSVELEKEVQEEAPASNEISMKDEEVEVYEPTIPCPQRLIEVTMEHEDFLPKDLMGNHEEEIEEDNQGDSHSIEADKSIEEGLMERPIQEVLDEENTPTIIQPPNLDIHEVKF